MLEITFYLKKTKTCYLVRSLNNSPENQPIHINHLPFHNLYYQALHFIPSLHCFVRILHISIFTGLWNERSFIRHISANKWHPAATSDMSPLNPLPDRFFFGSGLCRFFVLFFIQGIRELKKEKKVKLFNGKRMHWLSGETNSNIMGFF